MLEFFEALQKSSLLQVALLAGLLASVACGVIGSYIVVRRITYIAGGIAHCVLGGLGAACYFRAVYDWEFLHPLYGAVTAALLAAVIIGVVSLRARQREDTVIGALWAIGMAIGVIFIMRIPGYPIDPMSYLFGDILMVTSSDLWLLGGLDVLVIAVGLLCYNQLQAVCFDEEFARLRGINVEFYYLLLLCLTALTVVVLVSVVGIVMVIALLTLPVAIAGHFCKTLWQMMLLAAVLSMAFTSSGLALCYSPELPPGATTILLAGAVYLLVVLGSRVPHILRSTRYGRVG
ncbi:MAG: metal ABC transporter permease [Phycisphaerae bacterium]|nr:metal ABC transporter permease [Phycisphaerae bacterium]